MKNRIKSYFNNIKGMSLVEVLTAMTIISLVIFCFAPLFLSYLKSITYAGDEIKTVNMQSGIMQTVISLSGSADGYSTAVSNIPLSLQANAGTTLSRNGTTDAVVSTANAKLGDGNLDAFKGDLLFSDADNPNDSYITVDGASTSSGLSYYPSSITDDFYKAQVLLVADGGVQFGESVSYSDFEITVSNAGKLGTNDYAIRRIDSEVVILEFYGGGKVCFENSPLTIKYRSYTCVIEIDAPMMIMVGEANSDGDYNYYVSRGEFDENGSLRIIQKEMNSTDAQTGETVELNSAMNDVEWVPAESADSYATDSSGNKYGYYIMCGDNGQVRRFWKNSTTGNYYWGGDYTYYTDYNLNHFSDATYINGTQTYSTDTSFKFISQRSMTDGNLGFNLSSKKYLTLSTLETARGLLKGLSVVSVTYSDDAEFYGADGVLFYYQGKKAISNHADWATLASTTRGSTISVDGTNALVRNTNITEPTYIAYSWLQTSANSYFDFYGITDRELSDKGISKASYPITLTSVDAIQITNPNKTDVTNDGSYYFVSDIDSAVTSGEGATTNMNYPQESYNLYCGYIPAFMDIFADYATFNIGSVSASYKYPTGFNGVYAQSSDSSGFTADVGSLLNRASNRLSIDPSQSYYNQWRMTLGVTPYFTSGSDFTFSSAKVAYYKKQSTSIIGGWSYPYEYVLFYPANNLQYAITGKFYDSSTYYNNKTALEALWGNTLADPSILYCTYDSKQLYTTNGEVVDITVSYLSHPYAIAVAANPTDDVVYDLNNDKSEGQIFYWNNRRETITFLDSASTVVPAIKNNEPVDIPVSLMVGYVLGGTVSWGASTSEISADIGSVMNNGIVFLRAGDYNVGQQGVDSFINMFGDNSKTTEYMATDNTGYKLDEESNVFHQFYYLNSRYQGSAIFSGEGPADPSKGSHIGNLFGAKYWQNNRHIINRSLGGGTPATGSSSETTNYEYIRAHPMTNTKVTCVAWGATWNGYPEAMWGTENGDLLSWWVNTTTTASSHTSDDWNDKSVEAEFQSYKWVDNVNGKTYYAVTDTWADTIGSANIASDNSSAGTTFSPGSDYYKYYYDKTSQATGLWSLIGFISTLETINDVEFASDYWIAVGDQSDVDPDDYCASGTYYGGGETAKAYSNTGSGSWVNVRYWVDTSGVQSDGSVTTGNGLQNDTNAYYHWRAVRISTNKNYNIVQINNLNGLWIATGYKDANNNDEYDTGEKPVICWTYNPLIPCGEEGGWSESVNISKFESGKGMVPVTDMGGINSCATRSED